MRGLDSSPWQAAVFLQHHKQQQQSQSPIVAKHEQLEFHVLAAEGPLLRPGTASPHDSMTCLDWQHSPRGQPPLQQPGAWALSHQPHGVSGRVQQQHDLMLQSGCCLLPPLLPQQPGPSTLHDSSLLTQSVRLASVLSVSHVD